MQNVQVMYYWRSEEYEMSCAGSKSCQEGGWNGQMSGIWKKLSLFRYVRCEEKGLYW